MIAHVIVKVGMYVRIFVLEKDVEDLPAAADCCRMT